MSMPCRWSEGGLKDFAGRVRLRRRFGFPGRIDDNERVWLTIGDVEATAEVWLNGQFLGPHAEGQQPIEFEITKLRGNRNELRVEVEGPETGGLHGEVALEIRAAN
jgi:beta-galactosidase/beta-glucuronidase